MYELTIATDAISLWLIRGAGGHALGGGILLGRQRLGAKDVQRGMGDMPGVESRDQRIVVDGETVRSRAPKLALSIRWSHPVTNAGLATSSRARFSLAMMTAAAASV